MTAPLLAAFWAGLLVSCVAAHPIYLLLLRVKSRQTISAFVPEHQSKQGTPTMGGLIMVVGVLVALLVDQFAYRTPLLGYLVGFLGFALVGFVDDFLVPRLVKGKRGLEWKEKLVLQAGIAVVAAWCAGIRHPVGVAVAAFLVLFFSNAYNFADGLDALAGSIGVFFTIALAAVGYFVGAGPVAVVSLALLGSFVPFLLLNAPPAKLFMGDVGSLPIGAVIGLAYAQLLAFDGSRPTLWLLLALLVLSAVLCAELVPVPLQIASVKLRKKKLFLKTPIHHGFETRGWPETRIVWRFAMVQFVCSAAAVSIVAAGKP